MKNFAIISGIMTLLILVLSELIPKSLGAHYWKRMTSITANILTWMIYITYPIVWMSRYIMAIFSPKQKKLLYLEKKYLVWQQSESERRYLQEEKVK